MISPHKQILLLLLLPLVMTADVDINKNEVYFIDKGQKLKFACDSTFGKVFLLKYNDQSIPVQKDTEINTASGEHTWTGDPNGSKSRFIMFNPAKKKYYVPIFFPIACKKVTARRRRLSAIIESNIGMYGQKETQFRQKILRKLAAGDVGPWKPNKNLYRRYESAVILGEVDPPAADDLKPLAAISSAKKTQDFFFYSMLAFGSIIVNYTFM